MTERPLRRRTPAARLLGALAVLLLASAAASPARAEDDLDRVKKAGVLRWGCDSEGGAPYVYKDPVSLDRNLGFEVEIADAIAQQMGLRAEPVQNAWDQLLPGLRRGDYDIAMNGIEMTTENQQVALFTIPYYVTSLEVSVRTGTSVPTSLQALRGMEVGALEATMAERELRAAGGISVSPYKQQITPYEDLVHKRIDVVVMDFPIAVYYGRSDAIAHGFADFGQARYGIAVRLGETRLADALGDAIRALTRSGKLRSIYERYGIWNGATAELLHDQNIARTDAIMLEKFVRDARLSGPGDGSAPPPSLMDKARHYWTYVPTLLVGALITLELSVTSMALAIVTGVTLALMRVYGGPALRWLAIVYIEGIRGTPLFIQLTIIFYVLPENGIVLGKFTCAVLGLGLNYAAYEAENYRAGITSIPLGQTEAAQSLGLTQWQTIRHIIVPQALRTVIPPVTNDFVALLKDSSIVSILGMAELTSAYNGFAIPRPAERFTLGIMVAVLYFLLGLPFARIAAKLEEKAGQGRRLTGHH